MNLDNYKNDKINREFLSTYLGNAIEVFAQFKRYQNNNDILVESCSYYDCLLNVRVGLGHLILINIINYQQYKKIDCNSIIKVKGTVIKYRNSDSGYSYPYTYGLKNCIITEVQRNIMNIKLA